MGPSEPSDFRTRPLESFIWFPLVLAGVGLLAMSIYRASTYPFTHDESLSFAIFTWDKKIVGEMANNHVLNTALMRICYRLFGPSEISLRLPAIVSHLGYVACSLLLLNEVKSVPARYLGFSLLNLNLFVLDFFFLARGYALGLAFTLLALELLRRTLRAIAEASSRIYLLWLGSLLASTFAVVANYAFLYAAVPIQLVLVGLLIRARMSVRSRLLQITIAGGACSVAVLWVIANVLELRRRGQLYFGGRVGFVSDTLGSLVDASFYRYRNADAFVPVIEVAVIASFVLLIVIALISVRGASLYRAVVVILGTAVALPIAGHVLFGLLLPIERAATMYVPLYGLAISLGYDTALRAIAVRWLRALCHCVVVLLTAAIVWIFLTNVSVSTCYSWEYEANTKNAFRAIRDDWKRAGHGRPVEVASSWEFYPSLNYYRLATRADWMLPVVRRDKVTLAADYVYAFDRDVSMVRAQPHTVLVHYPDTRSVVLRLSSN